MRIRITKANICSLGSLKKGQELDVGKKDARSLIGAGCAEPIVAGGAQTARKAAPPCKPRAPRKGRASS